jgi:hypothetical protein
MIDKKTFLKEMCGLDTLKVRDLLNFATSKQLIPLIQIIHHVVSGKIPITKSNFQEIVRKKKLPYIRRHFESLENVKKLIENDRRTQLSILYKIQSVLPTLLSPLFKKQ